MARPITTLLDAAGIRYRRVAVTGAEGFLLQELPEGGVEGISTRAGLFLIASKCAAQLAAAVVTGAEIAESGTLRLADRILTLHRLTRPGEPEGNLRRRGAWFQRRIR